MHMWNMKYENMKYESSIYSNLWVIGKVKVFVLAHADAGGTTIALWTFLPAS